MSDARPTPVDELSREELENIVEEHRELVETIKENRQTIDLIETSLWGIEDLLTDEWSVAVAQQELDAESIFDAINDLPDLEGVEEKLKQEQQVRTQKDSYLDRKIEILADELDVDLTESRIRGEDTITQVLRYGPEEVETRAYPVHERARELLKNAGEWGTITGDANGNRYVISAGEARDRLRDSRDENLSSEEIRRAFETILRWAGETRHAEMRKSLDGENKLTLYIDGDEQ